MAGTSDTTPEKLKAINQYARHNSLEHWPGRTEALMIQVQTRSMEIQAYANITRAADGRPSLGDWGFTTAPVERRNASAWAWAKPASRRFSEKPRIRRKAADERAPIQADAG